VTVPEGTRLSICHRLLLGRLVVGLVRARGLGVLRGSVRGGLVLLPEHQLAHEVLAVSTECGTDTGDTCEYCGQQGAGASWVEICEKFHCRVLSSLWRPAGQPTAGCYSM